MLGKTSGKFILLACKLNLKDESTIRATEMYQKIDSLPQVF